MKVTTRLGAVSLVIGGVLASASPALADVSIEYSYSGADYTVNGANGYAIWACDREDDGHAVKGQYYKRSNTSVLVAFTNTKGSPTCYAANSKTSPIYRHRAVEVVPWSADDYGAWKYPH
jgi:hypothetical protein